MFLKKVIPCLLVALASSAMSGCVMAEGRHHYGPTSDWHHHSTSHDQIHDSSWNHHAGPISPVNNASQHLGPPPPASATQHMGPPPAPGSAAQHFGPSADGGIHRWHS